MKVAICPKCFREVITEKGRAYCNHCKRELPECSEAGEEEGKE